MQIQHHIEVGANNGHKGPSRMNMNRIEPCCFPGLKIGDGDGADDLLPGGDTFFLLPTPTQGERNEFRSING